MPNPFFMLVFLALLMLALKPDNEMTESLGGTAADRQRIAELSRTWLDAYFAGDVETILAITHDEAVIMPHNRPTASGEVAIRELFESPAGRSEIDLIDDPAEIRITGSWAYTRGRYTLAANAASGDTDPVRDGRYLLIFEKGNGGWRLLRSIDNAEAAPAG